MMARMHGLFYLILALLLLSSSLSSVNPAERGAAIDATIIVRYETVAVCSYYRIPPVDHLVGECVFF